MGAQSKVWIRGRSLARIAGSNPAGGMDVCLLWMLCVVQVGVSATGCSLVQESPTECGVSLSVIWHNTNPLHLQWVGRRGQNKKMENYVNLTNTSSCNVRNLIQAT
jgi:hypothetical protein